MQLGEHNTWAKMTNFDVALRTPLIIRAPWMANSIGRTSDVLAEAVDFYPTLAALAGLPDPRSEGQMINGTSLAPVFSNPDAAIDEVKSAAYSQFAKPHRNQPFAFWPTPARNATEVMGYSVRVADWRYTCWFGFLPDVRVNTTDVIGRELYDHRGDPGDLDWVGEHVNVVNALENAAVVRQLHALVLDYIQLK